MIAYLISLYNTLKYKFLSNRQTFDDSSLDSLISERLYETVATINYEVVDSYDPSKPSILIIDDSVLILSLVEDYLSECKATRDSFNFLKFYGDCAPFNMKATLNKLIEHGLSTINYAIIDIVLPGKALEDNAYQKMDGIDVAVYIHKQFNCNKFMFFSGNALNIYVDFIQEKVDKFKKYFNKDLSKFLLPKATEDTKIREKVCKLLSGHITINE
jgi:CheY-like chemotaxis protein